VWFAVLGGELRVGGTIPLKAGSGYMPLPRGVWLTAASETADVEVTDTLMALGAEQPSAILTRAWQVFLAWIAHTGELDDIAERGRLTRKIEGERLQHSRALAGLSSLLRADVATASRDLHGDRLVDACAAVGAAATPISCKKWAFMFHLTFNFVVSRWPPSSRSPSISTHSTITKAGGSTSTPLPPSSPGERVPSFW